MQVISVDIEVRAFTAVMPYTANDFNERFNEAEQRAATLRELAHSEHTILYGVVKIRTTHRVELISSLAFMYTPVGQSIDLKISHFIQLYTYIYTSINIYVFMEKY